MPGWIIQGVRGEGKSLCAVGKIREYLEQGRPVATNLDLYLDKLLPESNNTPCYRLPDHPRLEDLEILPPAYDPKYKAEDKNGLLVLDELGTWLNARSWNDKTRLALLNWLFLSRKNHWDLILLAQDVEMIDTQVRTTLCDYLVQASRTDRTKIPYLGQFLQIMGFSGYMPKVHVYYVFYGLNTQSPPVERWKFSGTDLYDGYDTNQRFRDGKEVIGSQLVDMRATYSYLPPNILTRHKFIQYHLDKIAELKNGFAKLDVTESTDMAIKKTRDSSMMKGYIIIALAVCYLGYKFIFSPPKLPGSTPVAQNVAPQPAPTQPMPPPTQQPVVNPPVPPVIIDNTQVAATQKPQEPETKKAIEVENFMQTLLAHYRPRLSSHGYDEDKGFFGFLEWYDGESLVEKISLADLHAFGAVILKRPYGVELAFGSKRYAVTSWPKFKSEAKSESVQLARNP